MVISRGLSLADLSHILCRKLCVLIDLFCALALGPWWRGNWANHWGLFVAAYVCWVGMFLFAGVPVVTMSVLMTLVFRSMKDQATDLAHSMHEQLEQLEQLCANTTTDTLEVIRD